MPGSTRTQEKQIGYPKTTLNLLSSFVQLTAIARVNYPSIHLIPKDIELELDNERNSKIKAKNFKPPFKSLATV